MSKADRFEELTVWQNSRVLGKQVYEATSNWKDRELKDQIRRAVVSISSNIAGGFDRGSKNDFARFLFIARGSGAEVRSQLHLGLDLEYMSKEQFETLFAQVDYVVRQLSLLIMSLKN